MMVVVSCLNSVSFLQDMETGDWTAPPDAEDVVSPKTVDWFQAFTNPSRTNPSRFGHRPGTNLPDSVNCCVTLVAPEDVVNPTTVDLTFQVCLYQDGDGAGRMRTREACD